MSVFCPICQASMEQAGNLNIYFCSSGKKDVLESHAHVYLDDLGQQEYAKIIVAEYCFNIFYSNGGSSEQKTYIKILKKVNKPTWNQTPGMTFNLDVAATDQFEFVELLTINSAVRLPWNDHSKVREAVKTYLLFS